MYRLLNDRFEWRAGTIVYPFKGQDYGLSREDTEMTRIKHISVTLKEDGSIPFFTVPEEYLEEIKHAIH